MTDLKSLANVLSGCLKFNERDQKILYEHYYGYCLKIVFRYIFRYDNAVEVVNDGFVKILCNLKSFNCPDDINVEMRFLGWIRTIMVNTSIDRLRKNKFLPEIGLVHDGLWVEDKSSAADNLILYKELINEIKKLPPTYRIVFNMFVIDGYSHNEIANILDISVGTSKSNLYKARAILKNLVQKVETNNSYVAFR